MEGFRICTPTECVLEKDADLLCGKEIKRVSDKVLFVHYGDGFMYESGLHERIVKSLSAADVECFELSGVQPNPLVSLVRKGVDICCKNEIQFVLAVGGGSVIDTAKAVALGAYYEGDVWDFFCGKAEPKKALPVGCVMTLPATGSEGSLGSVIRNEELMETRDVLSDLIRPRFVLMNPELTYKLPARQTVFGIIDMFTHVTERYFSNSRDMELTDRLCEGIMKAIIHNAPQVLENPEDFHLRAEFMWTSVLAHNGLIGAGRNQDWATHDMGASLSAIYNVPHGAALSVLLPKWAEYVYHNQLTRFVQFAVRVFDVEMDCEHPEKTAVEGIRRIRSFFDALGAPSSLNEIGITEDCSFSKMAEMACHGSTTGCIKKLSAEDIEGIYRLAYGNK